LPVSCLESPPAKAGLLLRIETWDTQISNSLRGGRPPPLSALRWKRIELARNLHAEYNCIRFRAAFFEHLKIHIVGARFSTQNPRRNRYPAVSLFPRLAAGSITLITEIRLLAEDGYECKRLMPQRNSTRTRCAQALADAGRFAQSDISPNVGEGPLASDKRSVP